MRYHLGDVSILENLPKKINLSNDPFILQKTSNGDFVLFSAICPHQHNVVSEISKKTWRCPSHDWLFDSKNGNCINVSNEKLDGKKIFIENDQVYVEIEKQQDRLIEKTVGEKIPPKITIVGSAFLDKLSSIQY